MLLIWIIFGREIRLLSQLFAKRDFARVKKSVALTDRLQFHFRKLPSGNWKHFSVPHVARTEHILAVFVHIPLHDHVFHSRVY